MNIFEPLSSVIFKIGLSDPKPIRRRVNCFWSTRPVLCESDFQSALSERILNSRKVENALRSSKVSPHRIEFTCQSGADTFAMIESALGAAGGRMECVSTEKSVVYSRGDLKIQIIHDHSKKFIVEGESERTVANVAAAAMAKDLNSNFRSWSYSSEFAGPDFLGGGAKSLFDEFFGSHENDLFDRSVHGIDLFEIPRAHSTLGDSHVARGSAQTQLESLGVQVYFPLEGEDWSSLADYESEKSEIEESVLLGLEYPEIFANILKNTRANIPNSNRPRVVLFEGPPGTGKSSSARVIARKAKVPLIHIPLESIVSKWFGESEKNLGEIFKLAKKLANEGGFSSVLLFIDEIDSLVTSRDIGSSHEASKRILSVLLRQIEGMENDSTETTHTTLICATNRKQDLDAAFQNRIDTSIHFRLPDEETRVKILQMYAKHLSKSELEKIASITKNMSGRNLKDICQSAERYWAATLIRKGESSPLAPPVDAYIRAAEKKFQQDK